MKIVQITSIVAIVASLSCFSLVSKADSSADAEKLLTIVKVDRLTAPVFKDVDQMFASAFAESKAPATKKDILNTYQKQANEVLEKAIGWPNLKGQIVPLFTKAFSDEEIKQLISFYESPLGKKVLEEMPKVTQQGAEVTQKRLQSAAPQINKLLEEMMEKLGVQPNTGAKKAPKN